MSFNIIDGKLLEYIGNETEIIVPDGVKEIGEAAFFRCNAETIILPNSLRKIGEGAFRSCGQLNELLIPDSVTTIGKEAFMWSGITQIRLPKKLSAIRDNTFQGCKLEEIALPEKVKSIGRSAFEDCYQLRHVTLPTSLKKIGEKAFRECSNLKEINLASDVEIGDNAFALCDKLSNDDGFVVINGVLHESPAMYRNLIVEIPEGVTVIGNYSCKANDKIEGVRYRDKDGNIIRKFCRKIIFPSSVLKIGMIGSSNVEEVEFRNTVEIPPHTFSGCAKLKRITIPRGTVISLDIFGYGTQAEDQFSKLDIQYI